MAPSDEKPAAQDEFEVLQNRVIRELDELNERIEAVIGEFVRPRLDEGPADAESSESAQPGVSDELGDHRKAA